MPYVEVNGQRVFYEDSGGAGPAVLFSHGFLMDHTMFDPQVEALAPALRCIRWDARGFGATQEDGAPFTYWDSAADAVALLDHLGVDSAAWVGMSQGGYLSLRAALAHPDRVRALVLIDTAADRDDEATIAGYRELLATWAQGTQAERQEVAGIVGAIILGDERLAAEWIPTWLAEDPQRMVAPAEALLGRDDVSPRLTEIEAPALVIHGTQDQAVGLARGEALCAGLPDCRALVRVEGAAHAANLTHPETVNPALVSFLDEVV